VVDLSAESPVIVLTGYSDLSFGVKSLALGISDYILKEELTAALLHKSISYSRERKKISSELERSEKQARSFAQQLNQAIEDERLRIAREIHDEFGQQLSGIKMALSAIKNKEDLPDGLAQVIEDIVTDVNLGILSLRQISGQLRPVLLDKLGLIAALEWLFSDFEKRTKIETKLQVSIEQPILDKMHEIHLFRICQEALTNIIKHAEATSVEVCVKAKGCGLDIRIADNGKGMNVVAAEKQSSMGLLNMRERASLSGAQLNISSELYRGTTIQLTLQCNGNESIDSR
jgi:signal transduction histidine kinase